MVRLATHDDVQQLVELGALLHAESSYASIPFDHAKVENTLQALMNGVGVVFVAEVDSLVVGGLAGGITEQWFSREKLAFDYSFFIVPQHRGGVLAKEMIDTFIAWARMNGAGKVRVGITTGIRVESTGRLYRSCGFKDAGVLFERNLNDGH